VIVFNKGEKARAVSKGLLACFRFFGWLCS